MHGIFFRPDEIYSSSVQLDAILKKWINITSETFEERGSGVEGVFISGLVFTTFTEIPIPHPDFGLAPAYF